MNKISAIAIKIALCLFMTIISLQVNAGEKNVGLRAGYMTKNEAPIAGLFFKYSFSQRFRLSTTFDYYFRHYNTDAYSVNINGEFPFQIIPNKLKVFPLAGFGITSRNIKYSKRANELSDDSSTRNTGLGVNIGAGLDYYVTSTLKLGLECKYGWVKNYAGEAITLSIGYVF